MTTKPSPTSSTAAFKAVCLLLFTTTAQTVMGDLSFIPLLHYDFTMEACQAMDYDHAIHQHEDSSSSNNNNTIHHYAFANQGFLKPAMSLQRNVTATSCALGMGIEAKQHQDQADTSLLAGSEPMGAVLAEMQDANSLFQNEEGLTMTMWIKHASMEDQQDDFPLPLLTIGRANSDNMPAAAPSAPCDNVDFQVSMICDQQLEWIFKTSDQFFSPCQRMVVDLPDNNTTTLGHISVSLANRKQQLFYNGKLIAKKREVFDNKIQHWDHASELHFFSDPSEMMPSDGNSTAQPWAGQLLQFAMFPGAKDEEDIAQLLSEGLPPTQPFALTLKTNIMEDAMDENGHLQSIELPISYLAQEVDILLSSLEVPHQPASQPKLYITRFPSRGSLKSPGSIHELAPVENFPVFVHQAHRNLIFLPRPNEHSDFPGSPYASFEYCWTTDMIVSSSKCTSATVSVVVNSVNDPPVAIAPQLFHVREGIKEEKQSLKLTGFDVDIDDYIAAIQVTTDPSLGHLYLSVGTFREQDHLLHGTLLSSINNMIPGPEAYVEYRFTEYDQVVIRDGSVFDSFRFRVQDSRGAWSEEVEAQISVLSSVFPHSEDNSTWMVHASAIFAESQLLWDDISGLNRPSGILIESPPEQGKLMDASKQVAEKQSIFASTSHSLNITYYASEEGCGQGELYLSDSFSYRVVSFGEEGQITSISNLTTKHLRVQCSPQPLRLRAKDHAMKVTTSSPGMDGPCNGYVFNFSDPTLDCSDKTALTGIYVDNPHKQQEPVLVSISTENGVVTLDREASAGANLIDDQEVMRSSIRLLCPAEILSGLLSSIHYQSETAGSDEMRIMVQYGQCNHTMTYLLENSISPPSPDCPQEEILIPIEVSPNSKESVQYLYRDFPWISWSSAAGLILFILIRGKMREKAAERKDRVQWQEHLDDNTDEYFYENLRTGERIWETPEMYIPSDEKQKRPRNNQEQEQGQDALTLEMTTTSGSSSVNSD